MFSLGVAESRKHFTAALEIDAGDVSGVLRGELEKGVTIARWHVGGERPDAIVATDCVVLLLLSSALVDALATHEITGWSTFPVELAGRRGEPMGAFYGLVVRGRCGAIDLKRSDPFRKPMPVGTMGYRRGLYFEPESWDGADIFMAPEKGFIFVTERARGVIAALAKTATFTPLTEVETPDLDDL
ncbi:MAG: hypothetical protein IPL61_28800 [Myxococcales bacterium]|nr:hypothetical protein [Myxococcales bacterium]